MSADCCEGPYAGDDPRENTDGHERKRGRAHLACSVANGFPDELPGKVKQGRKSRITRLMIHPRRNPNTSVAARRKLGKGTGPEAERATFEVPLGNPTFVTATQSTHHATRKKLREAEFFLRLMATVDRAGGFASDPEAAEFYFSAFVSAARSVGLILKAERTAEWNAWIGPWEARLTDAERAMRKFFVETRNTVQKVGPPGMIIHISGTSAYEFRMADSPHGGNSPPVDPATKKPMFPTHRKSLIARPEVPFTEACQPFFDLTRRMVEDFERDHLTVIGAS